MSKIKTYFKIFVISIVTIYDITKLLIKLNWLDGPGFHAAAKTWAKRILWIIGVKLEIKGLENISKDESYIFTVNHSSLLDIPILQVSIPNEFRIIYKKELEKIPIFGVGLKKSPYIGIIREDPRKSMQSMEEAIVSIKSGDSVTIFPEGTRTTDGELQEFKRGAFMLASRSGKPIVPVAIIGTANLVPNGKLSLKSGKAKIVFGKAIHFEIKERNDEKVLMALVHKTLKTMIAEENFS